MNSKISKEIRQAKGKLNFNLSFHLYIMRTQEPFVNRQKHFREWHVQWISMLQRSSKKGYSLYSDRGLFVQHWHKAKKNAAVLPYTVYWKVFLRQSTFKPCIDIKLDRRQVEPALLNCKVDGQRTPCVLSSIAIHLVLPKILVCTLLTILKIRMGWRRMDDQWHNRQDRYLW